MLQMYEWLKFLFQPFDGMYITNEGQIWYKHRGVLIQKINNVWEQGLGEQDIFQLYLYYSLVQYFKV